MKLTCVSGATIAKPVLGRGKRQTASAFVKVVGEEQGQSLVDPLSES